MSKPVRGRSLIQTPDLNAKKGELETVIQTPGLGARTGVWNIVKVENCAPKVGRRGPTAENTRYLDPRSRLEKGGVERG